MVLSQVPEELMKTFFNRQTVIAEDEKKRREIQEKKMCEVLEKQKKNIWGGGEENDRIRLFLIINFFFSFSIFL